MKAQAWYSSQGAATNTATRNASLTGAKNAPAGFIAIICCPAGSRETSGSATHVYSLLVNGSSASSTSITPAMARSRRARSSTRWSSRLPSPSSGAVIAGLAGHVARRRLVAGNVAMVGGGHRRGRFDGGRGLVADGPGRAAHGVELAPRLGIGRAHRCVDVARRVLGFAQAALELVGGQLALQFAAHRVPLRARAPHPQPGEARRLRQPFRAEHEQRHHRDDEEFGETDVEHGRAPRGAASALDVVVVALLVGRRGLALARLAAQLAGGLVVVVAHALLEFLDRAAKVLGAAGQALGAEDQQHDREHDQPVPDTETAHGVSRMSVGGTRRITQHVTGPAAVPRSWPGCPGLPRPAGRAAAAGRPAPWPDPVVPAWWSRWPGPRPLRPPPAARRHRCRARRGRPRW